MKQFWFVATIILKCEVAGEPTVPNEWTCLQQIHVLRALDREEAYEKAIELGKSLEHSYLNVEEQVVTWTFVGLENLEELPVKVIRDGTEIWGRIFSTQAPDALVVDKDGLSVFYIDEIRHLTADEIIKGIKTRLVCNRVEL
jgi:enterochelin esterase-like enzyme